MDSRMKRKNGQTLTLTAKGPLVDAGGDSCYNTHTETH